MQRNTNTFGVELETILPATITDTALQATLPPGWSIKHDGSIRPRHDRGERGREIVSPVLIGSNGIEQCREAVAALNAAGARVNRSCGFHVHVGFRKDFSTAAGRLAMKRVLSFTAKHEKAIYATTGTRSRELGIYSKQLAEFNSLDTAISVGRADRYRIANISLCKSNPTIEFRAFAGTLNINKVIGHVLTAIAIIQHAATDTSAPTWAPVGVHDPRPAKRLVEKLLAAVHFCDPAVKEQLGITGAEVRRVLRTLRDMAAKYDGGIEDAADSE